MTENIEEHIWNNDGTVYLKQKVNKIEDKYWITEDIVDYVFDFLKEQFPDCLIMREFGKNVDIFVLDEKLPVEIQATDTYESNGKKIQDHQHLKIE